MKRLLFALFLFPLIASSPSSAEEKATRPDGGVEYRQANGDTVTYGVGGRAVTREAYEAEGQRIAQEHQAALDRFNNPTGPAHIQLANGQVIETNNLQVRPDGSVLADGQSYTITAQGAVPQPAGPTMLPSPKTIGGQPVGLSGFASAEKTDPAPTAKVSAEKKPEEPQAPAVTVTKALVSVETKK